MTTTPCFCAIAAGDTGALERLYRELRVAVFAVAVSVVRDRALAEDVLHDTFVRVCEKAHTYRPATRPRAWVLEIARNLAIDSVRRRARQRPLEDVAPDVGLLEHQGSVLAGQGRPEEALAAWQRVFELDGERISARYSRVFLLERLGRLEEAEAEWEAIIAWLRERDYEIQAQWPERELTRLRAKIAARRA
jgi:RNA polymerase sigma factor (sigma-70 family)